MRLASKSDLELLQRLIDSGLVKKSAITQLLESRKQAYEQAKKRLSGRSFLLDIEVQELQVIELVRDQELAHLEFKESHYRPIQWETWGTERLILDASGHYQSSLPLPEQGKALQYGMILTEQTSYAYTNNFLKDPWLAQTPSELCTQVHKTGSLHMPYDLHFSPDQQWLAISNRGSGYIQLISTKSYQTQFQVQIREAGGSSAINISFDHQRGLLYATDNHSSSLFCVDLDNGQLEKKHLKLGQLGNLALSGDGQTLFLLSLKPHEQLLCVDPHNWQSTESIPLKGSLYKNNSNAPCDLIRLSPDQEHLVVLTYQNAPRPFTPLLTVINANTAKTLSRTALKDAQTPVQLCFGQANPLLAFENSHLQDVVVEAGLVSEAQIKQLSQPQINSVSPIESQEFIPPVPFKAVPVPAPEPEAPETQEFSSEPSTTPDELNEPEPTDSQIDLALFWDDFIVSILKERFQTQHLIDLESQSEAIKTLYQQAPSLRAQLEQQACVTVQIDKLSQGRSLSTSLRRRDLWLAQAQQSFLLDNQQPIPLNCPHCHQKLMASWDCQTCGMELESPLRSFQNRIASKPAHAGLSSGHFLLTDPERQRLIEVNSQREVVWELVGQDLPCKYPIACTHLPAQDILLADAQSHQVFSLNRQGEIQWSFNTFLSEAHQLNRPVAVKYRQTYPIQQAEQGQAETDRRTELRFLIVDQGNHRVLEVNLQHQILWSFGQQGEAGDGEQHLNHPSDIEYTPQQTYLISDSGNGRVLEVNAEGQIEHSWTAKDYPWTRPVFARRLNTGDTLVLDDAQFQVFYLSARGFIEDKIPYYKSGMPPEIKLMSPTSLQRLSNQDLIVASVRKALQILPVQKKLLWCLPLEKLKQVQKIREPGIAESAKVEPPVASAPIIKPQLQQKSFANTQPPKPKSLSASERLQAFIERRPAPSQQESYEHSVVFKQADAELLSQSFYMLDQRHNGVVRVNRKGRILWSYGYDLGQKLAKPNFVHESDHALVITDTYHNRVIEISKFEKELLLELTGPADQPLAHPRSAQKLGNGNYLIADQNNKRLLELSPQNQIIWQYSDEDLIHSPYYVEALDNGQILFVDSFLKRVVQMDREGHVHWSYGAPLKRKPATTKQELFGPTYATRLSNGHTLIADTYHHRVLDVDPTGQISWEYTGHARNGRVNPTHLKYLADGHLVITFFNHTTLIELKPDKSCVWSYTLGKDLFQPPVQNDDEIRVQHQKNTLQPFYNPIEKRQLIQAKQGQQQTIELHLELFDNVQMKSIRAQTIMLAIEKFGLVFKTFPAPEELLADRYGTEIILACILDTQTTHSDLQQAIESIAEVSKVTVYPLNC